MSWVAYEMIRVNKQRKHWDVWLKWLYTYWLMWHLTHTYTVCVCKIAFHNKTFAPNSFKIKQLLSLKLLQTHASLFDLLSSAEHSAECFLYHENGWWPGLSSSKNDKNHSKIIKAYMIIGLYYSLLKSFETDMYQIYQSRTCSHIIPPHIIKQVQYL